MRRGSAFFRRNQYKIAAVCVVAAVLGLAGVSMLAGRGGGGEPEPSEQLAEAEAEEISKKVVAKKEQETEKESRYCVYRN